MSIEIEAKYHLDESRRTALQNSPRIAELAAGPAQTKRLISTYYDSSKLHLKGRKIALRVRETGSGYVQTVKGDAPSEDGLSRRIEVEWTIDGPQLDGEKLRESQFASHMEEAGGVDALTPVFVTDFQRELRDLVFADGTQVELALDKGKIISGAKEEPIHELELELKAGNQETLLAFCRELQAELNLEAGNQSKAKRGYALFTGK